MSKHIKTPKGGRGWAWLMLFIAFVFIPLGMFVKWWLEPSPPPKPESGAEGKTYSQMLQSKGRVLCADSLPDTGCQELKIVRRNANEIEFHQIANGGRAVYIGKWNPENDGYYEGLIWMDRKVFGEFIVRFDEHNTGEGWVRPRKGYDEKFSIQVQRL